MINHMYIYHMLPLDCTHQHICPSQLNSNSTVTIKASDAELVLFDLRLNKRLRKQSWGWWFGTLSRPLWRHCNVSIICAGQPVSIQPIIITDGWQWNHGNEFATYWKFEVRSLGIQPNIHISVFLYAKLCKFVCQAKMIWKISNNH